MNVIKLFSSSQNTSLANCLTTFDNMSPPASYSLTFFLLNLDANTFTVSAEMAEMFVVGSCEPITGKGAGFGSSCSFALFLISSFSKGG